MTRRRRGQTLVLALLLMLVVMLSVFLTFVIGARTRRKIQLQAVADAGAYSLAVAEARALNFYALSNRAIVAHNVSILSVHAYQSYFSFYEDMLAATGRNFRLISEQLERRCRSGSRESCAAQGRARRVSALYLHSFFEPTDVMPHICDEDGRCHVDQECANEGTCDLESARKRGADWFHQQWHSKDNSNTCLELLLGSRDHFKQVQLLRAHQLRVDLQLRGMMTGRAEDLRWSEEERAAFGHSTTPHFWNAARQEELQPQSLAQTLARLSDPGITAQESAGRVSLAAYKSAVDNGLLHNLHKDYDEVLSGTRFPDFLTQRGFFEEPNWARLRTAALKSAGNTGRPSTTVLNRGTARMVKLGEGQADPGSASETNPLDGVWPPAFPGDPAGPGGTLPPKGRTLAATAHRSGHDQFGFGESDGVVAEDHGVVRSEFRLPSGAVVRASTDIRPGRNGVWGDPHDYELPPGSRDGVVHSFHAFHGDIARVSGHGTELGECAPGTGCDGEQLRGFYRGHMRFRIANLDRPGSDLWNMPRTVALMTRDSRDTPSGRRYPWDFRFQARLPGPVSFDTLDGVTPGSDTPRTMAALGAGLVYFHKPPNSGEEYREPPNLWNPFWRAKLHPLRLQDAQEATRDVHADTFTLLTLLRGWSVVNY